MSKRKKKLLILAHTRAQYRLYVQDKKLRNSQVEFVTGVDRLRGISPKFHELVFLPDWERNRNYRPIELMKKTIAHIQAEQEPKLNTTNMAKLVVSGADFLDMEVFGDEQTPMLEQVAAALKYAKGCENSGMTPVCIYDPAANNLILFPQVEGYLGMDDLEETQLREYLGLPSDHDFDAFIQASYSENGRSLVFNA